MWKEAQFALSIATVTVHPTSPLMWPWGPSPYRTPAIVIVHLLMSHSPYFYPGQNETSHLKIELMLSTKG